MKDNNFPRALNQSPAGGLQATTTANPNQGGTLRAPSAEEVARKAYFTYLNEGSLPGHDVKHWLEAEAHLMAEFSRAQCCHNSQR